MRALAAAGLALLALAPAARADNVLAEIGQFDQPTAAATRPGDPHRLYVVEREGRIRVVRDGVIQAKPFLDIHSEVRTAEEEQGMVSMTFDPSGERAYVYYNDVNGDGRVEELRPRAEDPGRADLSTRRTVIVLPFDGDASHNGGEVHFGPDGMLWISPGDGGGANDPFHNGQNLDSLLGKILRIDPRGSPYSIPAGNPFTAPGDGARDEIWAYGFRNPWRFSFDRSTGDLYVGDVGQVAREEIDVALAGDGRGPGRNYGWPCWEGTRKNTDTDPQCDPPGAVFPALEHARPGGRFCAIVGGYVVRDRALGDELYGRYLYGDFCALELRSARPASGGLEDDRAESLPVQFLAGLAEDDCGRLYVVSNRGPVYSLAGGATGPCGAPLDDDGPKISLRRSRLQRVVRHGSVSIGVRCGETCRMSAGGTVSVPNLARAFSLEREKGTLAAHVPAKLQLKLSASAVSAIRKALARGRRVIVRVSVKARDLAGRPRTRRATIRARG